MKISRQVGTQNQILNVFIQDAASSTGAGLANVSTGTYTWWRTPAQAAASSASLTTTDSMGTYSSGALIQISSSLALGWYQFGAPNGVFVDGDTADLHLFGATNMVPLPIEIELTKTNNQQYTSSTNFSSAANVMSPVGASSVPAVGVSSFAIAVGVSSFALPVGVSSFAIPVGVSSMAIGVNVTSIVGSAAVTTAAGILATVFDLGRTANQTSTVSFPNVTISTQAVTVGGVNVTSIAGSAPVTSAPGVLFVSTDNAGLNAGIAAVPTNVFGAFAASTFPFSLRASSAAGTLPQLQYEMLQNLTNFSNSGDLRTLNDLDGNATSAVYQYDNSTAPNAITRVA